MRARGIALSERRYRAVFGGPCGENTAEHVVMTSVCPRPFFKFLLELY